MDSKQQLRAEYFFKGLVKEYRRTFFKPCSDSTWRQISVWQYAPHLKPSRAWERSLAEMNGVCWNDPWHTGICLPIALFAKAWFKDVLGSSAELCAIQTRMDLSGLRSSMEMPWSFFHAVIKCDGRYYDTLIPRGTASVKKVYGCDVAHAGMTSKIISHHIEFSVDQMKAIFQDFILPMKQKMYPEGVVDTEFQLIFKELV